MKISLATKLIIAFCFVCIGAILMDVICVNVGAPKWIQNGLLILVVVSAVMAGLIVAAGNYQV